MTKDTAIKLFNDKQIRTIWDDEQEKWYFSIVDVVGILTESPNPRKYWSVLKSRLKKEGSQLTTNCSQLKMQSTDGRLGRGYNAGTSIAYTFGIFIGRKFSGTSYEMYYSTTKE